MSVSTIIIIAVVVGIVLFLAQNGASQSKADLLQSQLQSKDNFLPQAPDFVFPSAALNHAPETIETLRDNLFKNEYVHRLAIGYVGLKPAIAVATNQRVFRLVQESKLSGYYATVLSFAYSDLVSIVVQKNIFHAITIQPRFGAMVELNKIVDSEEATSFMNFTKDQMEQRASVQKPSLVAYTADLGQNPDIYIFADDVTSGPFTISDVNRMLSLGSINADSTLGWHNGCSDWIPLRKVKGIGGFPPPPPTFQAPTTDVPDPSLLKRLKPRSYFGVATTIFAATGLPFGILMGVWTSLQFDRPLAESLQSTIPFGFLFGITMGVILGFLYRGKLLKKKISNRELFLTKVSMAMSEMGYNSAESSKSFYSYQPSAQAGLLAGKISFVIQGDTATFCGPAHYLSKLRKNL